MEKIDVDFEDQFESDFDDVLDDAFFSQLSALDISEEESLDDE